MSSVEPRLIKAISEPLTIEDNTITAHVSIGIAVYPTDGHTSDELINKSDKAMYRAKKQGKNRFAFYDADKE